ncbi:MAG: Periplasmic thiol:disulfide interchange protein DsbA [Micavibrio sp.]|nr:Periplasmic thiol:disulfide interchange protein DsbA [Micavibrio sp.]
MGRFALRAIRVFVMKKLSSKGILVAALAVILLAGAGVYAMNGKKDAAAIPAASAEPAAGAEKTADMNFDSASLPKDPMGARTLGDPKAPVKVEEFASLTCGHCAHFESAIFPEFKKKYIDTGKVFFTFTDFPLNAPALDASMVARCLPPERYFPFLVLLFGSQEQWAFSPNYKDALRQNAKLAGLSDEKFTACLANKKLKESIVQQMQERGQAHNVNSTPSFLVDGKLLTGALPIEQFDEAIEEAMKNKTTGKKAE